MGLEKKQTFRKILTHPNRNLIVKMLTRGDGVRAVAKAIKELHPDEKKLHVSVPTLQSFRKEKLNLDGDALQEIKNAEKEKVAVKSEAKLEKKLNNELKRLPAYKEKIQEAVGLHIDIRKELSELLVLVKARTEDLFDKASRGEITINEEANLQRYFQAWTTAIERWAKYVDKIADKTVETNVNVTVIEDQMAVLRNVIREILHEEEPEFAIRFLDKLSKKMSELSYRKGNDISFGRLRDETQVLTAHVEELGGNEK